MSDILTRVCTRCNTEKALTEFNLNPQGFMGRRAYCLDCRRSEYVSMTKGSVRKRNATNAVARARRRHLVRKFGITDQEYLKLLEEQSFGCAICGKPTSGGRNKTNNLAIDHDHKTGRVRGLLCTNCNTGIGQLQDDPELMLSAALYFCEGEVS